MLTATNFLKTPHKSFFFIKISTIKSIGKTLKVLEFHMFNGAEESDEVTDLSKLTRLKKIVADVAIALHKHSKKLNDLDKRIQAYENSGYFETVKRNVTVKSDFYGYIRNINKELSHEFNVISDEYNIFNIEASAFLLAVKEIHKKKVLVHDKDGVIPFNPLRDEKNNIMELEGLIIQCNEIMLDVRNKQNEVSTKADEVVFKMRKNLNA